MMPMRVCRWDAADHAIVNSTNITIHAYPASDLVDFSLLGMPISPKLFLDTVDLSFACSYSESSVVELLCTSIISRLFGTWETRL